MSENQADKDDEFEKLPPNLRKLAQSLNTLKIKNRADSSNQGYTSIPRLRYDQNISYSTSFATSLQSTEGDDLNAGTESNTSLTLDRNDTKTGGKSTLLDHTTNSDPFVLKERNGDTGIRSESRSGGINKDNTSPRHKHTTSSPSAGDPNQDLSSDTTFSPTPSHFKISPLKPFFHSPAVVIPKSSQQPFDAPDAPNQSLSTDKNDIHETGPSTKQIDPFTTRKDSNDTSWAETTAHSSDINTESFLTIESFNHTSVRNPDTEHNNKDRGLESHESSQATIGPGDFLNKKGNTSIASEHIKTTASSSASPEKEKRDRSEHILLLEKELAQVKQVNRVIEKVIHSLNVTEDNLDVSFILFYFFSYRL